MPRKPITDGDLRSNILEAVAYLNSISAPITQASVKRYISEHHGSVGAQLRFASVLAEVKKSLRKDLATQSESDTDKILSLAEKMSENITIPDSVKSLSLTFANIIYEYVAKDITDLESSESISALESENKALAKDLAKAESKIISLSAQLSVYERLDGFDSALLSKNKELSLECDRLRSENDQLKQQNLDLLSQLSDLGISEQISKPSEQISKPSDQYYSFPDSFCASDVIGLNFDNDGNSTDFIYFELNQFLKERLPFDSYAYLSEDLFDNGFSNLAGDPFSVSELKQLVDLNLPSVELIPETVGYFPSKTDGALLAVSNLDLYRLQTSFDYALDQLRDHLKSNGYVNLKKKSFTISQLEKILPSSLYQ